MSDSAFWFIISLASGGIVLLYLVELIYRRWDSGPDAKEREKHRRLMEEIKKHG